MHKVVAIVGMCGSGKSIATDILEQELNYQKVSTNFSRNFKNGSTKPIIATSIGDSNLRASLKILLQY